MINLQTPFTDQYGNTHQNAVVVVNFMQYQRSENRSVNYKVAQGQVSYEEQPTEPVSNLHFNAVLYKDAQALAQGFEPIPLRISAHPTGFYIQNVAPGDTQALLALCEQHLMTHVFTNNGAN